MEHAHIQITHVEPYFTEETLRERPSKFERANKLSCFVFETAFTKDGRPPGDVTKQCMRKTVLTSRHFSSLAHFHSVLLLSFCTPFTYIDSSFLPLLHKCRIYTHNTHLAIYIATHTHTPHLS